MPKIGDIITQNEQLILQKAVVPKIKVICAIDAPNIDFTLHDILRSKPTQAQRPDFMSLYGWIMNNSSVVENYSIEDLNFIGRVFMNFRDDNRIAVQKFVTYVTRGTPWSVLVKNKGDMPADTTDIEENIDIDSELLSFVRKNSPTSDQKSHFYFMTNDMRNVGEYAIKLATNGHRVHVVCFTEFGNFQPLIDAGVRVIDYRDTGGVIDNISPKPINFSLIPIGEARVYEAR